MRTSRLSSVAGAASLVATLSWGAPAWAANPHHGGGGGGGGGGGTTTTGIDVSYPQCSDTLPSGEAFAIVGLNGGVANDYNSCFGSEFSYATSLTSTTTQPRAQTYLNTADPGNAVADWPSPSQTGDYGTSTTSAGYSSTSTSVGTPSGPCTYANGSSVTGANSPGCAYIYGYDMVAGITYSGGSIAGDLAKFSTDTGGSLYSQPVWLDVETGNSWQSSTAGGGTGLKMNVADLQGMVDAIQAADTSSIAPVIGVYSTSYQWNQITGTPTGSLAGNLGELPDWIPGARSAGGAAGNCSLASFTGGSVTLTQWFGHPYDGDYSCIG